MYPLRDLERCQQLLTQPLGVCQTLLNIILYLIQTTGLPECLVARAGRIRLTALPATDEPDLRLVSQTVACLRSYVIVDRDTFLSTQQIRLADDQDHLLAVLFKRLQRVDIALTHCPCRQHHQQDDISPMQKTLSDILVVLDNTFQAGRVDKTDTLEEVRRGKTLFRHRYRWTYAAVHHPSVRS